MTHIENKIYITLSPITAQKNTVTITFFRSKHTYVKPIRITKKTFTTLYRKNSTTQAGLSKKASGTDHAVDPRKRTQSLLKEPTSVNKNFSEATSILDNVTKVLLLTELLRGL